MTHDLSINTLIITLVVGVAGWALKGTLAALGDAIKKLIETLVKTMAKVEMLDSKMADLIKTVGDVQKMKNDLNGLYGRLKTLEEKTESQ